MLTASSPDTYELTHGLEECGMTVSYDGTEGTINFSVSEIGQDFFHQSYIKLFSESNDCARNIGSKWYDYDHSTN